MAEMTHGPKAWLLSAEMAGFSGARTALGSRWSRALLSGEAGQGLKGKRQGVCHSLSKGY